MIMDEEFIEFIEKVVPDGDGSVRAYNADETITEEELIELSRIGRADYETSCTIMRSLLDKREGKTIPLLYRKAIFFIAYNLYDEVKTEGVQSKVVEDLGLAHNTFTKWGLEPIRYYKEGNDWGADIELQRDGKKRNNLLYLFNGIVSRVKYKKFVDVFGGLGAVTASKPIRKGTKGYINDFDIAVANLLGAIKFKPKAFEELCKKTVKEIELKEKEDIFKKGIKLYAERVERQHRRYDIAVENDNYPMYSKIEATIKKLENEDKAVVEKVQYSMGLQKKFEEEVDEYQESKTDEEDEHGFIVDEERVNLNSALAYYYLYAFTYKNKPSITGVNTKNLKAFEKNISKISEYSERLQNVEIRCSDFKLVIEDGEINAEDTLIYADSPYYRTSQYDEGFTDKQHIQLHDSLKKFKGKWIFSCRDKMTNNSKDRDKDKKIGDVEIGSLLEYFEMYDDIAKYVVRLENDRENEIMITNFDFVAPSIQGFKAHEAEVAKKEYEYLIDKERGIIKETYEEFLERIRKEFKELEK